MSAYSPPPSLTAFLIQCCKSCSRHAPDWDRDCGFCGNDMQRTVIHVRLFPCDHYFDPQCLGAFLLAGNSICPFDGLPWYLRDGREIMGT